MPRDEVKECYSFNADDELERKSAKYDITAVGALFCRHGYIGWMLNCFTGERFAYALLLIYLCSSIMPMSFFWYDVNCRFQSRAQRWLKFRERNGLEVPLGLAGGRLPQCPLPPMHKNMHSAKCQMQNEAARFVGAGRPPGEPPEIFWAILGLLGPATQYMDPVNRRGRIERQVQWMEQESDVKHAPLLMRFEARAFEAVRTSTYP